MLTCLIQIILQKKVNKPARWEFLMNYALNGISNTFTYLMMTSKQFFHQYSVEHLKIVLKNSSKLRLFVECRSSLKSTFVGKTKSMVYGKGLKPYNQILVNLSFVTFSKF